MGMEIERVVASRHITADSLDPVRYIDSIMGRQHIALFYEDPEYARILEFRFIKNGLELGEHGVYATDEDSGSIVLRMLSYGIPIRYFQTGMLKVYQIHHTTGGRENIRDNCRRDIGNILAGLDSPFRMVSRIMHGISTKDALSAELDLEHALHRDFEGFGGSLLCPHDLSQAGREGQSCWQNEIIESHHAIILAPRFGEGSILLPKSAGRTIHEHTARSSNQSQTARRMI